MIYEYIFLFDSELSKSRYEYWHGRTFDCGIGSTTSRSWERHDKSRNGVGRRNDSSHLQSLQSRPKNSKCRAHLHFEMYTPTIHTSLLQLDSCLKHIHLNSLLEISKKKISTSSKLFIVLTKPNLMLRNTSKGQELRISPIY